MRKSWQHWSQILHIPNYGMDGTSLYLLPLYFYKRSCNCILIKAGKVVKESDLGYQVQIQNQSIFVLKANLKSF